MNGTVCSGGDGVDGLGVEEIVVEFVEDSVVVVAVRDVLMDVLVAGDVPEVTVDDDEDSMVVAVVVVVVLDVAVVVCFMSTSLEQVKEQGQIFGKGGEVITFMFPSAKRKKKKEFSEHVFKSPLASVEQHYTFNSDLGDPFIPILRVDFRVENAGAHVLLPWKIGQISGRISYSGVEVDGGHLVAVHV